MCWHFVGVPMSRLFEHLPLLCQLSFLLRTGSPHEVMGDLEIPGGSHGKGTSNQPTRNQEPGTSNQESRTRNQESRTRNHKPRTILGTRNQEPGTRNQEPGIRIQEPTHLLHNVDHEETTEDPDLCKGPALEWQYFH